jgi:hypothetical protein
MTPGSTNAVNKKHLRDWVRVVGVLAELADSSPSGAKAKLRADIENAETLEDLDKALERLQQESFGIKDVTAAVFQEKFAAYRKRTRRPTALMEYLANIAGRPYRKPEENDAVVKAVEQFVRNVVFFPDSKEFKKRRYDPKKGTHLETIAQCDGKDKISSAYAGWQKSVDENEIPQEYRLTNALIVDSDEPDDLLLANTEVRNCQSIHGSAAFDFNKALMAFPLDGKYRVVAAKRTANGQKIYAQRMLILLWDETAKKPVIHLGRHYGADDPKVTKALREMAKEKARQMGCPLVCAKAPEGRENELEDEVANDISSLSGSISPFEYVDGIPGESLKLTGGVYRLPAAKLCAYYPPGSKPDQSN